MPPSSPLCGARPLAAVVDLGTNAARLAMATAAPGGGLVAQGRWRELIRLGEGVGATGRLSEGAVARGLACLRRFAALIAERRVDLLDAVATSALREAANGAAFIERAARETGIRLRVISAEEEARLALAGVMASLAPPPSEALVFDIGGGSLEVIRAEGLRPACVASLPAGVVYLTERHLRGMPTPPGQVAACAREVRQMLAGTPAALRGREDLPLIGCGGAVALAWFVGGGAAPGEGINGAVLEAGAFGEWTGRFAGLDFAGRRAIPGFEAGREDVALAGLIVVREMLAWSGKSRVRVSTGGVREGRLMELLRGGEKPT